jgi:hypothetical protein
VLTTDAIQLLRELIGTNEGSLDKRSEIAARLAIEAISVPTRVESAINRFLEAPSWPALDAIRIAVLRDSMWSLGADVFVRVAADVALRGVMTDAESAVVFATCPEASRKELTPSMRTLIEVAEAVTHDADDGVMGVEDDHLFRSALVAITSEVSSK